MKSPVPGGRIGLYVPLSVRLSPTKKMFENWADALPAASVSATAVAAIESRKRRMTNISSVNAGRDWKAVGERKILIQRTAGARDGQRACVAGRSGGMSEGTALNARSIGRPASTRLAIDSAGAGGARRHVQARSLALPATADDDLPGRVGRVANLQGSLQPCARRERRRLGGRSGSTTPIAQGDNLFVERDGLAEIDYGGGQFRLAGETNLHVARLDDRQLALFVAAGRVIVRVRVLDPDDSVRIDTPATQVALVRPGLYRIDVAADSPLTSVDRPRRRSAGDHAGRRRDRDAGTGGRR